MPRIIVLGGRGFFGAAVADGLRREGARPLIGLRRPGGDLLVNAEDSASLRAALHEHDVVIDAAGPFQIRSTVLIETALAIGCDVIDLSDSVDYYGRVQQLAARINSGATRVLTSCSSVSAVSAALVRLIDVAEPVRASAFLAPATRNTSTLATAQSLFSTLDRPIRIRRGGRLVDARAFSERRAFEFAQPVGRSDGRLSESADALTLPPVWPSLRDVDFWVDLRRGFLNAAVAAAARHSALRMLLRTVQPVGRRFSKMLGARSGGFAVEVEDATGAPHAAGFVHHAHSYLVAVAPAILAARSIAAGTFAATGLVRAHQQVDPRELVAYLSRAGIRYFRSG